MIRRPPRSTRTDTLVPYTTLCRSRRGKIAGAMQAEHRLPPRILILAVKLRLVIRHVVLAVVVEIRVVELREVRVDRRLAVADALLPRFFLLARYFRGVVFRGFTAEDRKSTRLNSSH